MGPTLTRVGRGLVVLAVTTPLTAGCAPERSEGGSGAASCAAVVEYQGHNYLGHGELKRHPTLTGRQVSGTVPGCADTGGQGPPEPDQVVEVAELAGVPLETAFLWNGSVFLREGRAVPAASSIWFRSPRCATAGAFEVVGDWLEVTGPRRPRFDGDLRPPYRLVLDVTEGPSKYLRTKVTIHADATTEPALGPAEVRASLWKGGQVLAVVTCDSGRFEAMSLRVPHR